MPVLTVRHRTTYRYRKPVSFGEHRLMLRPRDSGDQRQLSTDLQIVPTPSELRWTLDVFGNCIAIARFKGRARELIVTSVFEVDHAGSDGPLEQWVDPYARTYPFSYDPDDMPDLQRSIERQHHDSTHALDRWARSFLRTGAQTNTLELLKDVTLSIRRQFTYKGRQERGIQPPADTLRLGTGSCRDFAVLMIEAVRCLGFAARFVSGYIYVPTRQTPDAAHKGGGNTHAWVQVYVPGAGWIEFDPTNGIVGSRDLIRVAVVRDAQQAVPLSGSWTGAAADCLGMEVSVLVTSDEEP